MRRSTILHSFHYRPCRSHRSHRVFGRPRGDLSSRDTQVVSTMAHPLSTMPYLCTFKFAQFLDHISNFLRLLISSGVTPYILCILLPFALQPFCFHQLLWSTNAPPSQHVRPDYGVKKLGLRLRRRVLRFYLVEISPYSLPCLLHSPMKLLAKISSCSE